jgi:hypothetical protein
MRISEDSPSRILVNRGTRSLTAYDDSSKIMHLTHGPILLLMPTCEWESEPKEDMTVAESMQKKSLDSPDETRTFDQGKSQVVSFGDFTVTRNTFEPGWRWSEHVKPIAGTDSCQVPHTGYVVSGD